MIRHSARRYETSDDHEDAFAVLPTGDVDCEAFMGELAEYPQHAELSLNSSSILREPFANVTQTVGATLAHSRHGSEALAGA
ncbi:MAG: hypothetical protein AAF526_08140 [Pseudomonadota bacterium]